MLTDPQYAAAPARRRWVVAAYVLTATIWLLFSELGVPPHADPEVLAHLAENGLFLLVTATVLALVLRWYERRLVTAGEARRASDRQVALVAELTRDVIYRIEHDPRRFSFVSPAIFSLLGVTPEEVLGDAGVADRFIHPADRELRARTTHDEVIRLRWRHRDGRTVWTEQRNRTELRDGVAVATVGIARDVTEAVLISSTHDACSQLDQAVLDGDGLEIGLALALSSVADAFEVASLRATVSGTSLVASAEDVSDPDRPLQFDVRIDAEVDVPPAVHGILQLTSCHGPVRLELAPSQHTPAARLVRPLLDLLAARVDAAVRHDRRRRELEQVEVALGATGIAIMLTDGCGNLTWVNEAFEQLTGVPAEQALSGTVASFVPPGGIDLHAALVSRITAGMTYDVELPLRRSDGSTFLAAVTVAPVRSSDGMLEGGVASIVDVTLDRRATEELHLAQVAVLRRQRDLERERTQLVQTLSHELRTPLTVVVGAAQTLQRQPVDDETRDKLVTSLQRGTDDLLRHLDAVLAATDGLAGDVVPTTVRALVGIALEPLGTRHDLDRVHVAGEASWTGPVLQAAGLLRPLLHNALKFSDASSSVEVQVEVVPAPPLRVAGTRNGGGFVVIEIVDQGPGIPAGLVPALEHPFRQLDASVTRPHGGLGLGLHAARRAADRLGARLAIGTGPQGTRVRVELPIGVDQAGRSRAAANCST